MERSCVHGLQDNTVKMAQLPKVTYIFNSISIKINSIFWRNWKTDPQIHMGWQKAQNHQKYIVKEEPS